MVGYLIRKIIINFQLDSLIKTAVNSLALSFPNLIYTLTYRTSRAAVIRHKSIITTISKLSKFACPA